MADNPGPLTYHGTNTYLIDGDDGVTVLDPGPDSAAHVAAILAVSGGPVARMLVSHGHPDHVGALPALLAATGAPAFGFAGSGHGRDLADGDSVDGWTVLHTPGHAPDHLCFARADGVVFTADHVMSFATSVVIPPAGDMAAYMAGLRRLLARQDSLYLPGHGPPIAAPHGLHRGPAGAPDAARGGYIGRAAIPTLRTAASLVEQLYVPLDPRLRGAAEASVLAHLLKLESEGRAMRREGGWLAQCSRQSAATRVRSAAAESRLAGAHPVSRASHSSNFPSTPRVATTRSSASASAAG